MLEASIAVPVIAAAALVLVAVLALALAAHTIGAKERAERRFYARNADLLQELLDSNLESSKVQAKLKDAEIDRDEALYENGRLRSLRYWLGAKAAAWGSR